MGPACGPCHATSVSRAAARFRLLRGPDLNQRPLGYESRPRATGYNGPQNPTSNDAGLRCPGSPSSAPSLGLLRSHSRPSRAQTRPRPSYARRLVAGAASREGLSCGLREGGGRWWGGAGRRGGAGAGPVVAEGPCTARGSSTVAMTRRRPHSGDRRGHRDRTRGASGRPRSTGGRYRRRGIQLKRVVGRRLVRGSSPASSYCHP